MKDLRYDNDMECVLQILRCAQNDRKDAQNDKKTLCHSRIEPRPVILNGAAGGVKDLRYDNVDGMCPQILRCAQNDRKDAQNDTDDPESDVAPPPRSGGNLLSHPSGQYHRRWRA